MVRRKTTEEFIADAKAVHGDRYDYSKVVYVNSRSKIIIICPIHGEFEQIPSNHLSGKNCIQCAQFNMSEKARSSTKIFIANALIKHDNRYIYDKVVYTNRKTKVIITCPIHGDFEQTPNNHLAGQNCPSCTGTFRKTVKEFIQEANLVHKNKYNYDNVDYVNNHTKVVIVCPTHGAFEQEPSSHLNGCGCFYCGRDTTAKLLKHTAEEFIKKARNVHGDRYTYSEVNYINNSTNIIITCPAHGNFIQLPSNHLKGQGCSSCASSGFDKTKPAILYYLKITTDDNQVLYKIGITNRTVEARFSVTDLAKIEVIKQIYYEIGQDAYNKEQRILKEFKESKYTGANILDSGNTELFTKAILSNNKGGLKWHQNKTKYFMPLNFLY